MTNFESFGYFMLFSGGEIVAGDDLYGGSDRLLSQVTPKTGIVVKLVSSIVCLLRLCYNWNMI